jgi:hypothetical protein
MRVWSLAWIIGLALASTTSSAETARPVVVLQPSSNWFADYEGNTCALQRTFGDEQHQVLMELNDYTLGDGFRATVASSAFGGAHYNVTAGFQPGEARPATNVLRALFVNGRKGVFFDVNLNSASQTGRPEGPPTEMPSDAMRKAREAAITGLFVGGAFERDLVLQTGPMVAPMEALHKCVEDLERRLGVDPEALKAIKTPITTVDEREWAEKIQAINPTAFVKPGEPVKIGFRLVVDADGRVSDCYANLEGRPAGLAENACAGFRSYARFNPAQDASGKAVPSIYLVSVTWSVI